jgi:DNA-3-methyladenine glycosylase
MEEMARRRGVADPRLLCSGPGRLTEALGIGLEWNRAPLLEAPFELRGRASGWRDVEVVATARIGISVATERPWRFCAASSAHLSRRVRAAA